MHRFILRATSRTITSPKKSPIPLTPAPFPHRHLSSQSSSSSNTVSISAETSPPPQLPSYIQPPSTLTPEIVHGVNATTTFFIHHGVGGQHLRDIARDAGNKTTLVRRWQRMMEAFLGTQVHAVSGLGYPPDERGITLFNSHMATLMHNSDTETQERLRDEARVLWKDTLSAAFDIEREEIEGMKVGIVEARDMMHKVSTRMQQPDILESVAKKTGVIMEEDPTVEMTLKHTAVQEVLVHEVYLGGNPSLVSQLGFGEGEKGYVLFQCALADFQADPLVSQYIGTAMFRLLKVAGLDGSLGADNNPAEGL